MNTLFAALSDVGMVRERNEDSFVIYPRHRVAVVADGMGGHSAGDLASALAVTAFEGFFRQSASGGRARPMPYDHELSEEENLIVTGVRLANHRVFERAREIASDTGMGTTIVVLVFTPDGRQVVIGHVGDSRCYRLREGQLTQLTADHSLANDMSEVAPWMSAEQVRELPSNYITRALGVGPDVLVDILTLETEPEDLYLLCSDGLSGMLSDEAIQVILEGHTDLEGCCDQLVAGANQAGGTDNITVAIARVESAASREERDLLGEDEIVPVSQRDGLGAVEGGAVLCLRKTASGKSRLGDFDD
ncbi:MAG: serine/threonine-protein phosphatase [Myxococcales bacterium]|nr:serine/threonine-protein phosphatase [Myxococcales bacterium]